MAVINVKATKSDFAKMSNDRLIEHYRYYDAQFRPIEADQEYFRNHKMQLIMDEMVKRHIQLW